MDGRLPESPPARLAGGNVPDWSAQVNQARPVAIRTNPTYARDAAGALVRPLRVGPYICG